MHAYWFWLLGFLTVPAVIAFRATLAPERGTLRWKLGLAVLLGWILLILAVNAKENYYDRTLQGLVPDQRDSASAPGHGEARGYALVGGWLVSAVYVVLAGACGEIVKGLTKTRPHYHDF